jgi:prophage DNA circulation protein
MTWAFRTGKFRGIPFYVDTSARSSGRALVAHEIPHGRGEVWEDLGPELDVLAFDAYLVAPHTYLAAPFLDNALGGGTRPTRETFYEWRDKLLEALEAPGAATLIHPTFGSVLARARRWSFQESRGEQFFLRFALEFVRDREQDATVERTSRSGAGEADERTNELVAAFGGRLEAELETTSVAERARLATENGIRGLSAKLRDLSVFTNVATGAADLSRQAVNLARDAKALAVAPAQLVASVTTSIRDVQRAVSDASGALAAYEALLQLVPSIVDSPLEDANSRRFNGLVRGAALGGALQAAVRVRWSSYEQAVGARDRLLGRAAELEPFANDAEYDALVALRASLVGLVPPDGEQLPRVGYFTPASTTTALLVAWQLYADRSRDAEIIARNNVRNPNFVPGGRPLQVLVDAARG